MIQGFTGGLLNRRLVYNVDLPTFQRDFAALKTLDHGTGPAINFSRATPGTYYDANGVMQTASLNVPRFDHHPVTGESLGLLIERGTVNRHLNSQNFASGWAVNSADVTLSVDEVELAQTGVAGVGKIVCANTNDAPRMLYGSTSIVTGGTLNYTFSVFVKAIDGWPMVRLSCSEGTATTVESGAACFDLTNGTVSSAEVGVAGIQALRNGWFRCWVSTAGAGITSMRPKIILVRNNARPAEAGTTNLGVVGGGVFVWGAQLEDNSTANPNRFPTSYYPTTTTTGTRSGDVAFVTPVSSFFNPTEGTFFFDATAPAGVNTSQLFALLAVANGSGSNEQELLLTRATAATSFTFQSRVDSVSSGVATSVAATTVQASKLMAVYKANDFAVTHNGTTLGVQTTASVPTGLTHLHFGRRVGSSGGRAMNSCIRAIAYWPKRLNNDLLVQLST